MDGKQTTVSNETAKRWIPYIISGTSLAISCYTLHLLRRQKRGVNTSAVHRIPLPKCDSTISDENTANDEPRGTATLCRLMQPDDANGAGNVHGGTILKMISHAGWLCATRYINSNLQNADSPDYKLVAVMLRMEGMSFKLPMHIGEVCTCTAGVSFTSNHSLEVSVTVTAENALSAQKRVTNSARMWFVGVRVPKGTLLGLSMNLQHRPFAISKEDIIPIPALNPKHFQSGDQEAALQRYLTQKASRQETTHSDILKAVDLNEWTDRMLSKEAMDDARSGQTVFQLTQVTLPSDCFGTATRQVDGGYVMKMMDNVAGCCAFQWAKQRVVTIHISSIDFHSPVDAGNVCHCYGRLVFTSKRSMEIFVIALVHCDDRGDGHGDDQKQREQSGKKAVYKMLGRHRLRLVAAASFTFVALNAANPPKSVDVPQFNPQTEFERMMHSQAMLEYEGRKKSRRRQNATDRVSSDYKPTVVVGPSGVGKGTLLKALREHYGGRLSVAVSHTTRQPRKGEEDGVHYHFVSKEQFERDIEAGQFVEYARIYGNIYGTSKQAIKAVGDQHKICLLEIDYVGAKNIKESGIDANYLFITVQDEAETCKRRIEGRGTESKEQIEKRYQTAKTEFEFFHQNKDFFDASISNDDLEESKTEIIDLFKTWYSWL